METFIAIFTQLGVDSSLAYQFAIIVMTFVLANFIFVGKLQEVLELREEKTVKLENSADGIIEKVNLMQSEYKIKIDDANRVALKSSLEKKQKITQHYLEKYKEIEKEVGHQVDSSRKDFSSQVKEARTQYLAEAASLSQSLISKILK